MIVGYARTSTWDQTAGLAAQQRDLKAAGAEKVFSEQGLVLSRSRSRCRSLSFSLAKNASSSAIRKRRTTEAASRARKRDHPATGRATVTKTRNHE